MKKLADSLKLYARKLGLTDAEIARRSGLSEVRYGHYVRGRSEPDLATLLRICKVLNITPNDLLLREEKTHSDIRSNRNDEKAVLRGHVGAQLSRLNKKEMQITAKLLDALFDR